MLEDLPKPRRNHGTILHLMVAFERSDHPRLETETGIGNKIAGDKGDRTAGVEKNETPVNYIGLR